MRPLALAFAVLLAFSGLALVAPEADAWATCNRVQDENCPGTFCLGRGNQISSRADCHVLYLP